jgi:peroxiredoxin
LAAFQENLSALDDAGVRLVALSTDPAERAAETVERLQLTFPVGHSLPLQPTAARLGVYFEERRRILHAASFLVGSDGAVQLAVLSAGAVGRLMPDELLRLVRFWDRPAAQ